LLPPQTVTLARLFLVFGIGCLAAACGAAPPTSPTTTTTTPAALPAPAPAPVTYRYSGTVRDGRGAPVAGATVEAGPDWGVTDLDGRYAFTGTYETAAGRVRPPSGYEPNPKRIYESIPIVSGGQDLIVRRIVRVEITAPASLLAGARETLGTRITFDTGAVESPYVDVFSLTSSEPAVLKAAGGAPAPFVEGVAPGTAQVIGAYRGVSSQPVTVHVLPR